MTDTTELMTAEFASILIVSAVFKQGGAAEILSILDSFGQSCAAKARNDALEESARIADRNDMSAWGIATAIRKLKEQADG